MKVLIVDDDVNFCRTYGEWLNQTLGYEVESRNTGDLALLAIKQEDFDLVILDWSLGEFRHTGGDLVNEFRSQTTVPILILSQFEDVEIAANDNQVEEYQKKNIFWASKTQAYDFVKGKLRELENSADKKWDYT